MNSVWNYPKKNDVTEELFQSLRNSPMLSLIPDMPLRFLIAKGYTTVESINDLLYKTIDDMYDFNLMKDATKALSLIKGAIHKKWKICIMGDYDVDGIGATSLLVLGLRKMGANVVYHTNNRFVEGYGLKPASIDRILEKDKDTKIIITVDNGISAYAGVEYAKSKGLTVIVTDHHDVTKHQTYEEACAHIRNEGFNAVISEYNEILPVADAVIDPKQKGCSYPFKELCGAGIAFKLICALALELDEEMTYYYELIDIASLSTVADVVPLVSENRIIVKEGLKRVKSENRSFFRHMREVSKTENVTEETFGYTYGPMINARGRLTGDVNQVIEAIVTEDEVLKRNVVEELMTLNVERKQLSEKQKAYVLQLLQQQINEPVYIIYSPNLHEGLVGLIAGYIKEEFYRPVFVLTEEHGLIKGSARSIDGFHLKDNLDLCSDLLASYGGHGPAAGLTIKEGCFEEFERRVRVLARNSLTQESLIPKIDFHFVVQEHQISYSFMEELNILRPFGAGFEKPVISLHGLEIQEASAYGAQNQHLTLKGSTVTVKMFNKSDLYVKYGYPQRVAIMGYPVLNTYRGKVSLQFIGSRMKICRSN